MITVEDARARILSAFKPLPAEKIGLKEALGRCLAETVASDLDIPAADNSAMDGYAVRSSDITTPGIRLEVIYDLPAGNLPQGPIGPGQAVRIMTGAPMPEGADAVVMREETAEEGASVVIQTAVNPADHVRFRGEDIKKGAAIIERGTVLDAAQIGLLASVRHSMVFCAQRPVVAILATGDEIVDLDDEMRPASVSSSNSYTLISLIREAGGIPLYLGIARDRRDDLEKMMARAMRADLLLTSGGVSMGDFDLVKEVMTSNNNSMDFWQVAMKPGKPLAFGNIGGIPAIGLPGNPVSSMISFYQFARPAILKMLGAKDLLLPQINARLQHDIVKKSGRTNYIRGILSADNSGLCVKDTGEQGSGILSSMAAGNRFIVIPAEQERAAAESLVKCEIFGTIRS